MCKVVIIGAPRSGTNMLRDLLAKFPGVATWPCDEINYIWRHGNVSYPTDELSPDMATPSIQKYIRKQFDWVARHYSAHTVVEKTCANSLRVGFVDRILPDARYLYIRRDGLDVLGSAMKRWKAEIDIPYLARKARFVPLQDLPHYAIRYLVNRLYRLFAGENRLAYWGPTFDGLNEALAKYSLEEVCALQWQRCVDRADEAFEGIAPERIFRISYEAFVDDPIEELRRIARFVGSELDDSVAQNLARGVSKKNVGKGRLELGQQKVEQLEQLVGMTLKRHGYIN